PVRVQYAQELESRGIVTAREAEEWVAAAQKAMHDAHEALRASLGAGTRVRPNGSNGSTGPSGDASTFDTAVPAERLDELNRRLLDVPEGFTVHPKLQKQLERRLEAFGGGGGIDWGQAEALALASLV